MILPFLNPIRQKPGKPGFCFAKLLLTSLILLAACQEPETEADLVITKTEIPVNCEASQVTTRIKSDQSWKVVDIDQDWVTTDIKSGTAGSYQTLTISIAENTGDTERSAIVKVKSGATVSEITINQKSAAGRIDPSTVDVSKIYIPQELRSMDLYSSSSTWFYGRSKQSEHFIVFWGKGYDEYGQVTPTEYPDAAYRVNIDDLLARAEEFYAMNVNTLKFVTPGNSKTDQYKMMIFLMFQTEWLATGAGYDNTIGALWVSPNTCQPVGSTIAHEIGHSFQYQVFCDHGGNSGWRYGFGGDGGNGFWEQTAQWQSFQTYPEQAFTTYNFTEYINNCYHSTFHEWQRYASYFIHYYWAEKHGIDFIGKMWQQSGTYSPEDPAQAYMRLTGINLQQYNDEQYDYARRMATWDLDAIRVNGRNYIGSHSCSMNKTTDNYWQVAPENCIENHGYNIIRLNVPTAGTVITADFAGIAGATGYRSINVQAAGWRYGYVALKSDGTRVYSDMFSSNTGTATFTCPENCTNLWFVVSGAPTTYWAHAWDEDATNDEQWPYKVKFSGTNLYGVIEFTDQDTPHDMTESYDLSFPADAGAYSGTTVKIDAVKLCYAFVLSGTEITSNIGMPNSTKKIKFYGVNADGSLYNTATATGYGHWFNAAGNVCAWVSGSTGTNVVFSEFDASKFIFTIGQHPGRSVAGSKYKIRQALIYTTTSGTSYKVTYEFNITIT